MAMKAPPVKDGGSRNDAKSIGRDCGGETQDKPAVALDLELADALLHCLGKG